MPGPQGLGLRKHLQQQGRLKASQASLGGLEEQEVSTSL